MPKALCIFGLVISVLVLAFFGLDLATGFFFGSGETKPFWSDVLFVVLALILGYASWETLREQT